MWMFIKSDEASGGAGLCTAMCFGENLLVLAGFGHGREPATWAML